jgi:hypothetical protein
MVHEREGLTLGLESGDHGPGVHPQFNNLKRNPAAHGLLLLREVNHSAAALPDLFQKPVATQFIAGALASNRAKRRWGHLEKVTNLIMDLQKGKELRPQLRITAALVQQKDVKVTLGDLSLSLVKELYQSVGV